MAMAEDDYDYDFSDSDLDDLPANTLLHLEANAIRATQQPARAAPESDYGLDDGDEVINLDDDDDDDFSQAQQAHGYNSNSTSSSNRNNKNKTNNNNNNISSHALYGEQMQVEELPRPSQADAGQLLSRIKKVGLCCFNP
jgi:hypothetical protein